MSIEKLFKGIRAAGDDNHNPYTVKEVSIQFSLPKASFTEEQKAKLTVVADLMELSVANRELNCATVFKLFASCITGADATQMEGTPGTFPFFHDKLGLDQSQRDFLQAMFAQVGIYVYANHPVPTATNKDKFGSILHSIAQNLKHLP